MLKKYSPWKIKWKILEYAKDISFTLEATLLSSTRAVFKFLEQLLSCIAAAGSLTLGRACLEAVTSLVPGYNQRKQFRKTFRNVTLSCSIHESRRVINFMQTNKKCPWISTDDIYYYIYKQIKNMTSIPRLKDTFSVQFGWFLWLIQLVFPPKL